MSRESELLAEDERGRRAAQTEFERPLLLEAGAGTGKTTTLISRVLAWSLGAGWRQAAAELADEGGGGRGGEGGGDDAAADGAAADRIAARVLEGVVAVTFTEAAAAEMASRVAGGLAKVAAGEADRLPGFLAGELPAVDEPPRERRAAALLSAIDHLTVSTIHAWCRGLLANHAVDAGVHPDFGVDARGDRTEAVAREVVDEAIRRAYGAGDDDHPLVRLAARGIGPHRLATAVLELAQAALPAARLEADPLSPAAIAAIEERLAEALEAVAGAAAPLAGQRANLLGPQVLAAVATTLEAMAELPEPPLERLERLCAVLAEAWPSNLAGRLKKWRKGEFNVGESRDLGAGAGGLADAAGRLRPLVSQLGRLEPGLLDAARRAVQPLLAETQRRLRAQGVAGFASLLIGAHDLLADHPRVRRQIRGGLRQLLVDEFQDTDRVQCDLVRLLALSGDGRRPGLFLVGDPKQSIYGWRNADLGAYDRFAAELRAAGGSSYSLCRNFRSAPAILEEVDRVVAPVMDPVEGLQPRFEPLLPSEATRDRSGFRRGRWAPVELWPVSLGERGRRGEEEEVAELEARAVAADIRRLHEAEGVEWGEFGILLRSSTRTETFEAALRAAGVPFSVSRDRLYFKRREIIEAAALVRAIVDPADHVALLATLRAAGAGLPDAALLPLWSRGFPQRVTELTRPTRAVMEGLRELLDEVAGELPGAPLGLDRVEGWQRSVWAALERLARLRRAFGELPADRFVETVRRLTLVEPGEASRYLGQFRAAHLDRFFRELEESLGQPGGDVQAVLRVLRRSLREAAQPEEPRPRDPSENAVQVLTVHGAKGLEFGHLYLVQVHAGTGGPDKLDLDLDERWPSRDQLDYTLFGSPTPGFHGVREHRRRVEDAERVRTLYVALTRAKERLVLVGRWPPTVVQREPRGAASFLDLLLCRDALPGDLARLRDTAEAGWSDHGGVRWVFPAPEPETARPTEPTAALPAAAEVAGDENRLEQARRAARRRAALPLGRAASPEAAARLSELVAASDRPLAGSRDVALEVGTAVHRMLESWRLDGEREAELARGREQVDRWLTAALPAERLAEARQRAGEMLDRMAAGTLLDRLEGIAPAVLGREVPVLLPADDQAAGFVSGALDLVYVDPESGRFVVVDFKTDAVEGDAVAERAAAYRPQEELYARALHRAFGLADEPRTELWFLWSDRLWSGA